MCLRRAASNSTPCVLARWTCWKLEMANNRHSMHWDEPHGWHWARSSETYQGHGLDQADRTCRSVPRREQRSRAQRSRARFHVRWFYRGARCWLGPPGLCPTDCVCCRPIGIADIGIHDPRDHIKGGLDTKNDDNDEDDFVSFNDIADGDSSIGVRVTAPAIFT